MVKYSNIYQLVS